MVTFRQMRQLSRRFSGQAVATGSAFLVLSFCVVAVFNYALNIVLSWTLPAEGYGAVGVSQNLIFLAVWFLVAGFPRVIVQVVARTGEYAGEDAGDMEEKSAVDDPVVWVALLANLLLGGVLAGGLLVAYAIGLLPLGNAYQTLLLWVAAVIFAMALRMPTDALLQGRLRFGGLSLVRISEVLAQFACALLLVRLGYGAAGALAGFAIGSLASLFLSLWLARYLLNWDALRWRSIATPRRMSDRLTGLQHHVRATLAPAIPFMVANLSGVLMINFDLLAVKLFSPAGQSDLLAGQYQVAATLARSSFFLGQAVIWIIFPLVARHAASSTDTSTNADTDSRHGLRILVTLVLAINLVLAAIPETVITFFFRAEYGAVASTLRLLVIAVSMNIVAQVLAAILQAREHLKTPALGLLAAACVQVITSAWWVPMLGMHGAALSCFFASGIALGVMGLRTWQLFPGTLRVSTGSVMRHLVAFAVLAVCVALVPGGSRLVTALWIAGSFALYGVTLLALKLIDIDPLFEIFQTKGELEHA